MATSIKKPVRRSTTCSVPYGVNPNLVITLYPGGVLGIREFRRRKEYTMHLGQLYSQLVQSETLEQLRLKRRIKK